jgi:hypothetical protein
VKDLSSRRALAILLAPVLLILVLVLMGNTDQAVAKTNSKKSVVAIAFVSSFAGGEPVSSYQRIALNVISVRLNPSTDPSVSDFDPKWVTIGVPQGVGRSFGIGVISTGSTYGGSFGGSNQVTVGTGRSEVQIDMGAIQGIAQVFNSAAVRAKTYHVVELVLDPGTPGNVVPLCPGSFPAGEGCISYDAKFPQATPTPSTPQTIRAFSTGGIDLSSSQKIVTPLVIKIDPGVGAPPTQYNQTVEIDPTIELVTNTGSAPPFTNPNLASLQGTIVTSAPSGFVSKRPQAITARAAGTNNVVISQALPKSCNKKKTCDFIMYLPAASASAGGTNYDLAFSAKNSTYAVRSNINVVSGQDTDLRSVPMEVTNRPTKSFSGKVLDVCNTNKGVQAATLNILIPDPTISPAPDCSANPPTGCVVVASASTDEVGKYPLPGNGNKKAPFNLVAFPDSNDAYELVTTAAGFDRTPLPLTGNKGKFKCTQGGNTGPCNITLSHGTLTGNITLGSGTGPLSVLVAAEDSGTNDIQNLSLVTIPFGSNTVPYTINVPDSSNIGTDGNPVTTLDLFASAQDLFNGAPQAATGHSIAIASGVAAPDTCSTVSSGTDFSGMTCVGHGSASGTVTNPLLTLYGDTVTLSKDGVQIETVPVVPAGSVFAGDYSICAPADSYTLTHYQQATPQPTPVGSVSVTLNAPVMVPAASPSPCPGICDINPPNANSGCLTCTATSVVGP